MIQSLTLFQEPALRDNQNIQTPPKRPKASMDLVIDIGNTRVHLALITSEGAILNHWALPHKNAELFPALKTFLKTQIPTPIEQAVIVSVEPTLTPKIKSAIQESLSVTCFVMDRDIHPQIKNLTENPEHVGADRLMNSIWAIHTHPEQAVIVVSIGTAVTFDLTNHHGHFLGGAIAPGLHTGARALHNQTAMLPNVLIEHPPKALGQNTHDAISSGLYWGLVGAVDRVCLELKQHLHQEPIIVATGGDAELVAAHSTQITKVIPHLTMIGAWWTLQDAS
jgi:type III pantothenate kinase